jgi:hypothetical protein
VSPHLRNIVTRVRAGLWAGMSAEQVLLELLDAAEEALGPVDAGQEERP